MSGQKSIILEVIGPGVQPITVVLLMDKQSNCLLDICLCPQMSAALKPDERSCFYSDQQFNAKTHN